MRLSLRYRLLALAAIVLVFTLAVAGIGLGNLFHSHLERRIGQELDTHLAQLAGNLRFNGEGGLELVRMPADPRFERPYGGLYWQIADDRTGQEIRSRSLWDERLPTPKDSLTPGEKHVHRAGGPSGSRLLVHEQLFIVPGSEGDHVVRASVAVDENEVSEISASFQRETAIAMVVLGLVLMGGFAFQVLAGLRPIKVLGSGITHIRTGRWTRFQGNVPEEIQPLVSELNEMLAQKEKELVRGRDRAADLAHGLKTPLTALAADIRKLRERGEHDLAGDIEDVAEQMRVHVERELVRARIRHHSARPVHVAPLMEAMMRTLRRLPEAVGKQLEVSMQEGVEMRVAKDDFNEIVGNLGENALRHARSKVVFTLRHEDATSEIIVEDDGPGLPQDLIEKLQARGKRLDEAGGGAGLGLAIVQDIVEATGGTLDLAASGMGGLRVRVSLPEAVPAASD